MFFTTFPTRKIEQDEPTQQAKDFAAILEKATGLTKFQLSGAETCVPFGAFPSAMRDALLRLYTSKTLKTLNVGARTIPPDILAHLSPSITSVVLNGLWGITESDVIFLNSYQAEMVQWMEKNCPQEGRRRGPNIRSFSSVPSMDPLPIYLETCPSLFQNLQKLELEAYSWKHPPISEVQKFMELVKDTLEDMKITFNEFNLHDPSGQTPTSAYLDFTTFNHLRHVSLSFTYTWQARHFPEYETMLQNMLRTLPSLENLETLDVILSWQWGDEAIDELEPPKLHEALRVLGRSVPFIGQLDTAWAPFTDRERYKNLKRIRLSFKPWSEKSGVRPYDLSPDLGNWIQRFYNLYEFGYQALFPNLGRQRFFQYRTENNWFDGLDWVQPR
ncbi:hypothetical protein CC2G_013199 [Coprinopsis cinerea AmutBmut pab1-1]|nr:hypothetical protein CC2G_013199 [Coprinopsis cinerea AmutBmut pab1-1]